MYLTYNVKDYFDKIINFDNKSVLDFGCNHGNFLLSNNNFASYTGLDIDLDVLNINKTRYPQHNWIHYKNYNWQYNPNIEITSKWPKIQHHDIIVAYSVFTHTDFDEFKNTVQYLKTFSTDLLTTFLSSNNKNIIKEVLQHRTEYFGEHLEELVELIYNKNVISLLVSKNYKQIHVIDNHLQIPKSNNILYMLTFYKDEWIVNNLGGNLVDVITDFDGILGTQKCLQFYTHH